MASTRCLAHVTFLAVALFALASSTLAAPKYKVLIIDGQNNHKIWPKTTQMIAGYLEETGLFSAEAATTPPEGIDLASYQPDFSKYNLIVSNYNGAAWGPKAKSAFERFVYKGGAFISVHAANNAFPNWAAYNEMIGVGGWGKRNEESGPYIR